MNDRVPDLDRLQDLLDPVPAGRNGRTIGELDGSVAALILRLEPILPVWVSYGPLASEDRMGS